MLFKAVVGLVLWGTWDMGQEGGKSRAKKARTDPNMLPICHLVGAKESINYCMIGPNFRALNI